MNDLTGAGDEPGADDARELGDLFREATQALRRSWAAGLEPTGLSPHQARALRVIGDGGQQRLSALAEALRIVPRSATDVVDGLAERELVERVADPGDRRAMLVRLTDVGRRLQHEVDELRGQDLQEYFGRLTHPERAELVRLLRKLADQRTSSTSTS